jgi:hypothetical protein
MNFPIQVTETGFEECPELLVAFTPSAATCVGFSFQPSAAPQSIRQDSFLVLSLTATVCARGLDSI